MPPTLREQNKILKRELHNSAEGSSGRETLAQEIRAFVDRLTRAADTSTSTEELGWILRSLRYWQEALRLYFHSRHGLSPARLRAASDLKVGLPESTLRRVERGSDRTFDQMGDWTSAIYTTTNELLAEARAETTEYLQFLRTAMLGGELSTVPIAYTRLWTEIVLLRIELMKKLLSLWRMQADGPARVKAEEAGVEVEGEPAQRVQVSPGVLAR